MPTTRARGRGRRPVRLALIVVVAIVAVLATDRHDSVSPTGTPTGATPPSSHVDPASPRTATATADERVAELFRQGRSDEVVELVGSVERVLPDDDEGSRHQRFILRLASGHTLLVAHNIDLADRVPLRRGAHVGLRGEYEWNEEGGVIHWTHHDPAGNRPGGWIELEGVRYR